MWWPIKMNQVCSAVEITWQSQDLSFLCGTELCVAFCCFVFPLEALVPTNRKGLIRLWRQKECHVLFWEGVVIFPFKHFIAKLLFSLALPMLILFLYSSSCYLHLIILCVFLQVSCNVALSQPSSFSSRSPEFCWCWYSSSSFFLLLTSLNHVLQAP